MRIRFHLNTMHSMVARLKSLSDSKAPPALGRYRSIAPDSLQLIRVNNDEQNMAAEPPFPITWNDYSCECCGESVMQ